MLELLFAANLGAKGADYEARSADDFMPVRPLTRRRKKKVVDDSLRQKAEAAKHSAAMKKAKQIAQAKVITL